MLPARFHRLRDRAMAINDRMFAEPVYLKFNDQGTADPARPSVTIEAILRVGDGEGAAVSGLRVDASWRTRISAQPAKLHIDRKAYPGLVFRQGDEIRALAREGQPWFRVFAVDDRGETRLVLQLGEGPSSS